MVTFNDTSLCFSVSSVGSVDIEYSISTDGEPANTTYLRISSVPLCVDDPFPDLCKMYFVNVSAMNGFGNQQYSKKYIPDTRSCKGKELCTHFRYYVYSFSIH